jgi:hypothetical protein
MAPESMEMRGRVAGLAGLVFSPWSLVRDLISSPYV